MHVTLTSIASMASILYERLAQVPPTPGRSAHELPTETDPVFVQQQPQHPGLVEPVRTIDADQRSIEEYQRNHPNARVILGPDGRVVAIEDPSVRPRDALGLSGPPPPHSIPIVRGTEPGPGYETSRQPPPVPVIREPQQPPQESLNVVHDRSPIYHPAEPSSTRQSVSSSHHGQSHSHSPRHSRGSFSRHDNDTVSADHGRLDTLPPTHAHGHSRSSSLSGEGQVEQRSRRHDIHELAGQHGHSNIHHPRVEIPVSNLPPSPTAMTSPTHGRLHNHQRMGPGMHLHRPQDRDPELTRQLLAEREREKEREREREIEYLERRAREEEELSQLMPLPSWTREEQPSLSGPGVSRDRSRSDTPASGGAASGGGGGTSRPDSSQSHERERRSYAAPRVANLLSDPRDSYYNSRDDRVGHAVSHSRSYPPEYGSESSSRKRARHDMEIDDDHRGGEIRSSLEPTGGSRSMGSVDSYPVSHEHRGPKRVHPDDEGDMSPRGYVSSVRDEKPMEQDD